MKHKTSELEGALLDAAVALAKGHDIYEEDGWRVSGAGRVPPYSSMWEFGGPIIERERIWLSDEDGQWIASMPPHCDVNTGRDLIQEGPSPLVAAMRAYVASKLGQKVELP